MRNFSKIMNYSKSSSESTSGWSKPYSTMDPGAGLKSVEDKKNYYLNMEISKKRELYQCGKNYCNMKDTGIWSLMAKKHNIRKDPNLQSQLQGGLFKPVSYINDKIRLFPGNIAALEIDVIVNAANSSLLGGGGVDAVIHRAAGGELLQECRLLNGCETGKAKITGGYKLPAKYIIHTVGPIGENPLALESCYVNSLQLAVENKLRTIAFPCVSTGVFGYPNSEAAKVVLQTVRTFLEANANDFDAIIFCLFMDVDQKAYHSLLPLYFPVQ